jgi:hypothetical protein
LGLRVLTLNGLFTNLPTINQSQYCKKKSIHGKNERDLEGKRFPEQKYINKR